MLNNICYSNYVMANRYPQFCHVTLGSIFINDPVTTVQILHNSHGILTK